MTHRRQGADGRAARDRQIAALWAEGLTSTAIAARLGLAAGQVRVTARKLGLPKRRSGIRRPKSPARLAEDARLAELWATGLPAAAIAEKFGCEPKTVLNRVRDLGLPKRRAHRPAGPTPWAKATAAAIRQAVDEIGRRASSVVWPPRLRPDCDPGFGGQGSGQRAEGPAPTAARIAEWLESHGRRNAKGNVFTANSVSATIRRLAPMGLLDGELHRRVAAANRASRFADPRRVAQLGNPSTCAAPGVGRASAAPPYPAGTRFLDVDARTLTIERLTERRVRRGPAELLTYSSCGSAAALCTGNW